MKSAIKANWEAYHYCLAQSPNVELSIGRYLTWLMTNLPDHFMNLVVCNQLPPEGVDDLVASVLVHFRSMNIRKFSWLTHGNVPSAEINKVLLAHGLTFSDAFATEMAGDLSLVPDCLLRVWEGEAAFRPLAEGAYTNVTMCWRRDSRTPALTFLVNAMRERAAAAKAGRRAKAIAFALPTDEE